MGHAENPSPFLASVPRGLSTWYSCDLETRPRRRFAGNITNVAKFRVQNHRIHVFLMCPTPWPSGRPTTSIMPQRVPDISRRCSCRAPFNGPNHDRGEPVTPLRSGAGQGVAHAEAGSASPLVLLSTTSRVSPLLSSPHLMQAQMRRDMRLPYRPKVTQSRQKHRAAFFSGPRPLAHPKHTASISRRPSLQSWTKCAPICTSRGARLFSPCSTGKGSGHADPRGAPERPGHAAREGGALPSTVQ